MKKTFTMLILIFCFSCLSLENTFKSGQTKIKILEIGGSDSDIYDRVFTYLTKAVGNSNYAVRKNDAKRKHLVASLNMDCGEYMNNLYTGIMSLQFILDIKVRNGKVKISLENIVTMFRGQNTSPVKWDISKDAVRSCLSDYHNRLEKAIKVSKGGSGGFDF